VIDAELAHQDSIRNRSAIFKIGSCSCFFCMRRFGASLITEWTDGGDTAICPHCGIDSLLPGNVGTEELYRMNERWFCGGSE
jgi:hypothetical protein